MYEILIKKREVVEKKTIRWLKLHERDCFDEEKEPQYGYVEKVIPTEETIEIYSQILPEINLTNIIQAINSIPDPLSEWEQFNETTKAEIELKGYQRGWDDAFRMKDK